MAEPLLLFGPASRRFGMWLGSRSLADLTLFEARYPARVSLPPMAHHEPYFCIAISGSIQETTCRGRAVYCGGSIHFHRAGEVHQARTGTQGFHALSLVPARRIALRIEAALSRPADPDLSSLAAICHREFVADDTPGLERALRELTKSALAASSRHRPSPAWLEQTLDLVTGDEGQAMKVGALAARAGVHPVHFVRAFRRHVGCTPGVYLQRLRVEASRRALEATSLPLSEIALDAGFASQSHFTRAFRDRLGVPPGVYRRLLSGSDMLNS